MMAVADDDPNLRSRVQVFEELQKPINRLERQREVRLIPAGQDGEQREVVTIDMHAEGIGAVAKGPAMLLVPAPLGGPAEIVARTAAFRAGRAVTGARAVAGGGRGFRRAIAGDGQVLWQQVGLQRRFQRQFDQELVEPGLEVVGIERLVGLREQGLGQEIGLLLAGRIRGGAAGFRGLVQAMASGQLLTQGDVLLRPDGIRPVHQARQKIIITRGAGRSARREASQDGQDRLPCQASGPGGGAAFAAERHQRPGAQHGAGIRGRALPGGAIQAPQSLAHRIERQVAEDAQVFVISAQRVPEAGIIGLEETLGGQVRQVVVMERWHHIRILHQWCEGRSCMHTSSPLTDEHTW